jgi:hypothetical protein
MGLIPQEHRVKEVSSLLATSNLVNSVDWEQLRKAIPSQEEFESLVGQTL